MSEHIATKRHLAHKCSNGGAGWAVTQFGTGSLHRCECGRWWVAKTCADGHDRWYPVRWWQWHRRHRAAAALAAPSTSRPHPAPHTRGERMSDDTNRLADRVRALADEWEATAHFLHLAQAAAARKGISDAHQLSDTYRSHSARLRVLLTEEPTHIPEESA